MRAVSVVLLCVVAVGSATMVNQCPDHNIENIHEKVKIGNCNKPPCRLRKDTKIPLNFKFQAGKDVKALKQRVNANILGIEFPFVGVDNTEACDKIFEEDGTTKNNCQFEEGKTYIFKNEIDVLRIYPRVKTVVHWALFEPNTGKVPFCFEVPARITN